MVDVITMLDEDLEIVDAEDIAVDLDAIVGQGDGHGIDEEPEVGE